MSAIYSRDSYLTYPNIANTRSVSGLQISDELLASSEKYKMAVSQIEEILSTGSAEDQNELLQELAYRELRPPYFNNMSAHQIILAAIFYAEQPDPRVIASVILRSLEEAIDRSEMPVLSSSTPELGSIGTSFAEAHKLEDDKMDMPFSHGGGLFYLREFLSGNAQGYAREAMGKGIFITPTPYQRQNRDLYYAFRAPIQHFDKPAVLKGIIPANHLRQVNHNSYEAVIFPESVQEIKDSGIKPYDLKKIPLERIQQILEQTLPAGPMSSSGQTDYTQIFYEKIKEKYPLDELEKIEKYLNDVCSGGVVLIPKR